jgi:hypothetical protein
MLPGTLISENQRSRSVVVRSCGEGRKKTGSGPVARSQSWEMAGNKNPP